MNLLHRAYPHPIQEWMSEGVLLIKVEDYVRQGRNGDLSDDDGTGFPVRDDRANFEHLCLLADPSAIPIDASHILWFPS